MMTDMQNSFEKQRLVELTGISEDKLTELEAASFVNAALVEDDEVQRFQALGLREGQRLLAVRDYLCTGNAISGETTILEIIARNKALQQTTGKRAYDASLDDIVDEARNAPRKRGSPSPSPHKLVRLPAHKKFRGREIVKSKSKYPTASCKGKAECAARPRTYCQCCPGRLLCTQCFGEHIAECMEAPE